MKKVVVTGFLGTIGIFTTRELLKRGYHVIGIDNCSGNPSLRKFEIKNRTNLNIYNNNFVTIDSIFSQYKNIDAVIHLASQINTSDSFKNPKKFCDDNISFTAELLNATKNYGIPRFIFASSSAVYGDNDWLTTEESPVAPKSIYGITKATSEMLVHQYHKIFGVETISLRYYNTFAPIKYYGYQNVLPLLANKIYNDEPITLYDMGTQKRQYVPIENIVHANILALETRSEFCFGKKYNISVEEDPITLLDLVTHIYDTFKKDIRKLKLSEEVSLGDVHIMQGSPQRAKYELGYSIQKTMKDGINDYLNWLKLNNECDYYTHKYNDLVKPEEC